MPHYTPLISDFGFKVMFGNDANTDFLRRALQALIKSAVPLAEVQLLPDEQTKFTVNSAASTPWPAPTKPGVFTS